MKKIFYLTILFFISNCTLNKTIDHHGVHFLEKKEKILVLNKTNKNDIFQLLGPPSTRGQFDNDLWIYIERKTTTSMIKKLGRKELIANNVLILEINNQGMLAKKTLLTKNDIENYEFTKTITTTDVNQKRFLTSTLGSLRQRINDPLGKKRKKISER